MTPIRIHNPHAEATGLGMAVFRGVVLLALIVCAGCSQTPPATSHPESAGAATAIIENPSTPTAAALSAAPAAGELPAPQTQVIQAPPTATQPAPPPLLRLTQGGCCTGAFWSADSRTALFIDRPDPSAPAGLWQAPVDGSGASFFSDRLGIFSADLQLRAFLDGGETWIERFSDGQRWKVSNGGRSVSFSPGATRLAWTTGQSGPPLDSAQRTVWISRVDGSETQQVATVTGGGFSGWLTDDAILLTGRPPGSTDLQVLWRLDLPAPGMPPGQPVELTSAERLRNTTVSPGGRWVVYLSTFSADPAQDGLWLLDAGTGERRRLDLFGAYRWRDADRLLIIPLEPGSASDRVMQVGAADGAVTELTNPGQTSFKITGGDWSISPDGRSILFLSAQDNNLWVLSLP